MLPWNDLWFGLHSSRSSSFPDEHLVLILGKVCGQSL